MFKKAINIWNADVINALKDGSLVLNPGQWVKCGENESHLSRFISFENGIFNVVHYPNVNKKFTVRYLAFKMSKGLIPRDTSKLAVNW